MTVQLFEGCWGVTRGGEDDPQDVDGPIICDNSISWPSLPFTIEGRRYMEDGTRAFGCRADDIIAVFATEAEAEAYLAGEPANVVADMVEAMHGSPQWDTQRDRLIAPAPAAPKPVTWPDDKARVQQEAYAQGLRNGAETLRSMQATEGVLCKRTMNLAATALEDIASRAALLLAAADKVEGRG